MTTRTTYPSYRPSGVDWLGDIPSHWETRKLKQSVELIRDVVDASDTHRQYIGLEHVESATGQFLGEMDPAEIAGLALKVSTGDVIFGKLRPYLAKVALVRKEIITSTEFFALKSISLSPEYLQRLLISARFIDLVDSSTYGARMPRANWDFVGNIFIPLPPLDEQRAIADYLDRKDDEITRFIESRRRMIALLEEKKQAIINQAVTRGLDPTVPMKDSGVEWLGEIPAHWEVASLRRLLREPLQYGANAASQLFDPDLPRYVRITDITSDGSLSDDTVRSILDEEAAAYMLDNGDILLARSGATVGKSYLHANYIGRAAFAGYLIRARVKNDLISPSFLFGFLNSSAYWQWIRSSTIQATIENVSAEKYATLSVPVAPLDEQEAIVDFLAETNSLHTRQQVRYEREIELMQEYRTRLISDVVTGKVRVL